MRKDVVDLLKLIEEAKNNKWSEDWESLGKKGIEKSTILYSQTLGLIAWSGSDFYLTERGYSNLTQQKILENLEKINQTKPKEKQGVIFDSNILDKVSAGELSNKEIEESRVHGVEYFITHIQTDEISNCPDEEKRKKLTLFLAVLKPTVIGTESFILGTSRLGFAKLSDGQTLEKLRKGNLNHTNDALIGEVAIKNGLVLVSEDKQLRNKITSEGGKAIDFQQFKEMIK